MIERFQGALIVVRHAESDVDTGELTEKGRQQALELGQRLAGIVGEHAEHTGQIQLLTGQANRLLQTAEAVGQIIGVPHVVLDRLSMSGATRRKPQPSPDYDEAATITEVLNSIHDTTRCLILIAHSEMMNDLPWVHELGGYTSGIYRNTEGFIIDEQGNFIRIENI